MKDLTVTEAIEVLGVSRNTLMAWINDGTLQATKSAGATAPWLVPAEEVERVRLERIAELQAEIDKISMSVEDYLEAR